MLEKCLILLAITLVLTSCNDEPTSCTCKIFLHGQVWETKTVEDCSYCLPAQGYNASCNC